MKKRNATVMSAAYGKEPVWNKLPKDDKAYNSALSDALNWYAATAVLKDLKVWATQEAVLTGTDASDFKHVSDQYITTLGAMSRMKARGFQFNKKHQEYMADKISTLVKKFRPEVAIGPKAKRINPVDALLGDIMTQFDLQIDLVLSGATAWEVESFSTKITAAQSNELTAHYKASKADLSQDDSVEVYSVGKRVLNRLIKVHDDIIKEIDINATETLVNKKARKPRKKKAKPAYKLVAGVKYQSTNDSHNIRLVSINPEDIVGAKKLVTFNTKTRQLAIYYAEDEVKGLMVKGSTVKEFSDKSGAKTIRKPKEQLPLFLKAPKVKTDKIFAAINSVQKSVTGRINKDTILLKSF